MDELGAVRAVYTSINPSGHIPDKLPIMESAVVSLCGIALSVFHVCRYSHALQCDPALFDAPTL